MKPSIHAVASLVANILECFRPAASRAEAVAQPPSRLTAHSGYGLSLLAFLAVWALLSAPWLSGYVTIPYDAKAHFQAQLQFMAHAIHSGQSPFWSPHTFAGSPQVADPQSLIFSPVALLALLDANPSFRAMDTYVLAMLAMAGLAVIMFFRDRAWHPAGALVAAVALAFGASASWRVQHIGQIKSFALIWVALFLLSRALSRGSIGYGIAAGVVSGLMLAEPDQVALLGSYVLAGFIVAHWLGAADRKAEFRRILPTLSAASLAGALIVTLPLVLTMLFVADSNRPQIPFSEAVRGSLHPASLLTLLVGDLYGALDPKVNYWGPFSESWDPKELTLAQNMSQLYLGALPVLLILGAGLLRGRLWCREARYFAVATLVLVLYAVGRHTPAFALFYDYVPGVKLFRRPADATFLIGGLMAILGGYLLHRVLTDPARISLRERAVAWSLPAAGVLAALAVAATMRHFGEAWQPIVIACGWIILSIAAIELLPPLARAAPRLAIVLPAALLAADLAANNGPNESTALPPSSYSMLDSVNENETIRLLKSLTRQRAGSPRRDRVELVGLGFEWPNCAMVHGLDHVLGYNPLRLEVVTQAVGAGDTVAGPDQRIFTPLFPSYASRLADLIGLRYIASSVPIERVDSLVQPWDLRLIARTADAYVYENPRALPRVMFAAKAEKVDFAGIIRSGRWPRFDPTEVVLIEDEPQAQIRGTRPPTPVAGRANVRLIKYENTRVEIEVDSLVAGYVILNDVWHPWWQATVDDAETPILKANVLFRAVQVPAGKHAVTFEFKPIAGAIEELTARVMGPRPHDTAALSAPAEH